MEQFKLKYTRSRRQKFIMAIATILVFVTTYALILPAITIDTDTAEQEPGMDLAGASLGAPAITIQKETDDVSVTLEAPEGVFPEGTVLSVSLPQNDTLQHILEAVVESGIERYQAVRLDFNDAEGNTVEPQGVYTARIISEFIGDSADYSLVRMNGENASLVENFEFTYKQVEFRSAAQATFIIVEKDAETSKQISAEGSLYEATVTYDYTAQIPDGARLEITEIEHGSSLYEDSQRAFEEAPSDAAGETAGEPGAEAENAEDNSLFTDIIDLTIYGADGFVIEPAAPVQVSVKRKNLPEEFSGDDGSLIVQHLNESGDTPVVETMDSAVILAQDTLTASFETGSFSQYRLRWSSGARTVTVHYGHMVNGTFTEFPNGTPAHTPEYNSTNNYTSGTTTYAYLVEDVPGYKYKETRLNNASTGTNITPLLNYGNSNWRYTTVFDKFNYTLNWTNLQSGNNIYVIYEPDDSEPVPGGTPRMYESPITNPADPVMHKRSDNNHDGTRTITLSVDGHATPILVEKLADVIVILDISGSMKKDYDGNDTTDKTQWRFTKEREAIRQLADDLLNSDEYKNVEGRNQIRMSLVTFSNTAQYRPFDESDEEILDTDGTLWQPYPDYNFTTDFDKYSDLLDSIKDEEVTGGTNWEQALKIANEMPVDPERATYVIFVTDGDPTFRVTRDPSGAVTDARMQEDCDENFYRELAVFGHGSDDPYEYNYDAALAETIAVKDQDKIFYCIGVSDSVTKAERLVTDAGMTADHAFVVNNQAGLEDAFADIKASITGHVGWSDVHVTDGITSMTNMVAKTKVVGASDEFTYRRIVKDENGVVIDVDDTWFPGVGNDCNEATYNTETEALEWNMGPNFQLEDNVTYEVSFKVWPNQHAIDLVTMLNNGEITLDDLTPEEASQFAVEQSGNYTFYTLKTNTSAGMTYTPTRYSKAEGTTLLGAPVYASCDDPVDPLLMETMELEIKKTFEDSFGDETGDGVGADRPSQVVLYLETRPVGGGENDWVPVNVFDQGDGTFSNRIVLNETNKWKSGPFYVAPGLVDAGNVAREVGHEFRVREEDLDYHYELDPEVINPLMRGYADLSDPNLNYDAALRTQRHVYIVKVLGGDEDSGEDLTALNIIKGGLDISKVVVDPSGAMLYPDETFTIKGWIKDPDGNPYLFDPANDDRTDRSKKATDATPLFNAHQNDPIPYHFYDRNGTRTVYKGHFADTSDITIQVKAGETLMFPLIPIGSTFEFWEVDGNGMPTGYFLESATGILQEKEEDPVTGVYVTVNSDELDRYPITDAQNHISGTIYGNRVSDLTFTNRSVVPGKIVVRKSVVKSDLQTEIYPDETFTFSGIIYERYYSVWRWRYRGFNLNYVIRDKNGNPVSSSSISNTYNNGNGFTFNLKAGQYIEFLDVPDGAQYEFAESTSGMSADYAFVGASASAASTANGNVTQPSVSNAGVVTGTMHTNEEHDSVFKNRVTRDPVPLQMIKVYAKDQTERINGASFMLYSDAAHSTVATDYQGNPIGLITTGGFGDTEQTEPLGFAWIGELWPGTYYLVETVTPTDYRPPTDHIVITIGNDGSVTMIHPDNASATGSGLVTESNGLITVAIPNSKYTDSVLPRTGGISDRVLYISGGLFVLTAAALIYIFCFRQRKGGKRRPEFP